MCVSRQRVPVFASTEGREGLSCLPLGFSALCPWGKVSSILKLAIAPLGWLLSQPWWPSCLHVPTKHFIYVLGIRMQVPTLAQQILSRQSHVSGPQTFYIINAVCLNFCLDGIELCLPKVSWSPKRNHWVKVTWNFMQHKTIRKETWWRKWRLFGGKCCPAGVEASQPVLAGGALQDRRKPPSPTHKACCLDWSRSFHLPGCLPSQGWESSQRMVTNCNLILSSRENQ